MRQFRTPADVSTPRLRCSHCGDASPYLQWVPGGYWRGGSLLCDHCVRAEADSKRIGLVILVCVISLPLVMWALAVLVSFVQVLVFH